MTSKDLPKFLFDKEGNAYCLVDRSDDPDMWVRVYPVTEEETTNLKELLNASN